MPSNNITAQELPSCSLTIEEKYEIMKHRLASYSMSICASIVAAGGRLSEHFQRTTKQSAILKAQKRGDNPTPESLASELLEMLDEFSTMGVQVKRSGGSVEVINETCGCLSPFTSQAAKFGITTSEARNYACANCIPSYRLMTQMLDHKFEGRLLPPRDNAAGGPTDNCGGCIMKFSLLDK
jgi:hypothetical protein